MTILVAGATGLVGSAIVREFERVGKSVKGVSSKDVDLLDRKATFAYLADLKPATVIDAAARVGGIGANNLENPQPEVQPQLKELKSLDVIDKIPLYVPKPLIISTQHRPMYLN